MNGPFFLALLLCDAVVGNIPAESLIPRIRNTVHTSSSSRITGFPQWTSDKAVDGNSSTDPDNCNCCFATEINVGGESWWQLDLGKRFSISSIEVFGRTGVRPEQSQNFIIATSDNKMNSVTEGNECSSTYHSTGNMYTVYFQPARMFRYMIIGRTSSSQFVTICEVTLYPESLIRRILSSVVVTSSSTLKANWSSANAIDNNPSTSADACLCCFASIHYSTANAWWQIDLGRAYSIYLIVVYGRTDGIHYYTITEYNPGSEQQFRGLRTVISMNEMTGIDDGIVVNTTVERQVINSVLNAAARFRYLMVGKNTVDVITICEVKLYNEAYNDCQSSPCPYPSTQCEETDDSYRCVCATGFLRNDVNCTACLPGSYGDNCTQTCGNCSQLSECNNIDGICAGTCKPGFQGMKCDKPCDPNRYGQNCSGDCGHCSVGTICNNINGHCPSGCDAGYNTWDVMCNTPCSDGTYGNNCKDMCGQCRQNQACDKINGNCPNGCAKGYQSPTCKQGCDRKHFWYDCVGECHCSNHSDSLCDRYNGNCSHGCGFGWSGFNCSEDHNIIQPTFNVSQSSIYDNCLPKKAIDGRMQQVNEDPCVTCSATFRNDVPWFQIDLGQPYLLEYIGIYGRADNIHHEQTRDLDLYVSNTSMSTPTINNGSQIGNTSLQNGSEMKLVQLMPPRVAQYLLIRRWTVSVITLCEVKAYKTDCNITGYFGDACSSRCHCADEQQCETITGKCHTLGCKAGWKGNACNEACDHGVYGENCAGICGKCRVISECDHIDGTCTGLCRPGHRGNKCDTECAHRRYGQNCSNECNNCAPKTTCDKINGNCPMGCKHGYYYNDTTCNTVCKSGFYGDNCNSTCGKCESISDCFHVNGSCLGACIGGYEGETCTLRVEASQQDEDNNTPAIVGGVIAAVLVIIGVAAAMVFYKRRMNRQPNDKSTEFTNIQRRKDRHDRSPQHSSKDNSSTDTSRKDGPRNNPAFETSTYENPITDYYNMDGIVRGIKVSDLWAYVRERVKEDSDELDKEFANLPIGLQHPCTVGGKPELKSKNRYKDMYAYDHSRVVLKCDSAVEGDYVNASYINGQSKVKKFIAAQGPTKTMINDFWILVWQEKSNKIVMLTRLVEMATMKCLQYWPDRTGETTTYGNVNVTLVEETMEQDYTLRTLEVTKGASKPRTIRQFHFTAWPDKDIPDTALCLVDFWRTVDTRSSAVPIVVHCSAGIGRTGTFIALDNLVDQARSEGYVRPMQIVEALRVQRVNMVQTRHQYAYLHEALAEALLTGTHFIDTKHYAKYYQFMTDKVEGKSTTRIEEQYKLIDEGVRDNRLPKPEVVEYSNMDEIVSESDAYRPRLKNRGSDLIQNLAAYFLPSFAGKEAFLISMSPGSDHLEEFWSLVEEQHIITVIMLTASDHHTYQASCTLGGRGGVPIGPYTVSSIQEKKTESYTERGLSFRNVNHEDEDYLTTVKQFEYHGWRAGGGTPGDTQSMLDLLDAVQRWQPHLSESKPVLVHCGDGYLRSGLVVVLLNELQRVRREDGHVNLVESVFTMKQRNHGIIASADQLRYCYDVLSTHLMSSDIYQNV